MSGNKNVRPGSKAITQITTTPEQVGLNPADVAASTITGEGAVEGTTLPPSAEGQLPAEGQEQTAETKPAEQTEQAPKVDKPTKEVIVPAAVQTANAPEPNVPELHKKSSSNGIDLDEVLAGFNDTNRGYITAVQDYMAKMAKGRSVTDEEVNRFQISFYRTVVSMINNVENDFDRLFNVFLYIFNQNETGAFDEVRLYRNLPHINLGAEEFKAFQFLTDLFRLTGDAKTRTVALRQVDLSKSLAFGLTERGREKMIAFYGK
jgi:hypothetical protein